MANKKKKRAPSAGAPSSDQTAQQLPLHPAGGPAAAPAAPASSAAPAAASVAKKGQGVNVGNMFAASATSSSLSICRNKHWRYISSYHGPWLLMPTDTLESFAAINAAHARPRFVDPATFFDLARIRRLVDEAADLAVRAASGVVSSNDSSSNNAASYFGIGPPGAGRGVRLSPERRHRMRVEAVQKLARAYEIDEIAASVATMQSVSSLEDVAALVLERAPGDRAAAYVHFFHEKIPSRHLVECTRPAQMDRVLLADPRAVPPWRTRASVRVLMDDYEGAVADLTEALRLARLRKASLEHSRRTSETAQQQEKKDVTGGASSASNGGDAQSSLPPDEAEKPSTTEQQLLFHRANGYLALACQYIYASLGPQWAQAEEKKLAELQALFEHGKRADSLPLATGNDSVYSLPQPKEEDAEDATEEGLQEDDMSDADSPEKREILRRQADAQKLLRTNAKRAVRDYLAFLAHFDYAPDVPVDVAEAFTRRIVNTTVNRGGGTSSTWNISLALSPGLARLKWLRNNKAPSPSSASQAQLAAPAGYETETKPLPDRPIAVQPINLLFSETPPPGFPFFASAAPSAAVASPATDQSAASLESDNTGVEPEPEPAKPRIATVEICTYHPLLEDALHALLLAHCLLRTPPAEMARHARVAARLTGVADGYPIFSHTRCPARSDWAEVLRRAAAGGGPATGGGGWAAGVLADESGGASFSSWDDYCRQFVTAPWAMSSTARPPSPSGRPPSPPPLLPSTAPTTTERALAIARWVVEGLRLQGSGGGGGGGPRSDEKDGALSGTAAPGARRKKKKGKTALAVRGGRASAAEPDAAAAANPSPGDVDGGEGG